LAQLLLYASTIKLKGRAIMNPNKTQDLIGDALETCLHKMAARLKKEFEPDNTKHIKLLQQFRATISTWKSWAKQTATAGVAMLQSMKKMVTGRADKKPPSNFDDLPGNPKAIKIANELQKPTGLLCPDP
jgi:hypothetical protein